MIRLFLTTIISLLISFGAISKTLLASELLNHITQEHTSKTHSHHYEHKHIANDHHTDDSDDDETTDPKHSHSFEMSFLSLTLNLSAPQVLTVSALSTQSERRVESYVTKLNICYFSDSVFRPPIA